jgi:uncharacterized protein
MREKTGPSWRRTLGLQFAVLLTFILASAQCSAASIDCVEAVSNVDRTICHDPALAVLNDEVVDLFKSAADALMGAPLQALQADQRKWLDGREKCEQLFPAQCLYERYTKRLLVLEVQYGQGSSSGPLTYLCDQLEHEVSVSFFKTEPPAVGLAFGNSKKDPVIAVLQPSDKGEKYVTSERLVFLAQGDDASLALSNGKTTNCHLK